MHKIKKVIVKALSVSNFDVNRVVLSENSVRGKIKIGYVSNSTPIVLQTPFLTVGSGLKPSEQDPSVLQMETVFSGSSERKIKTFHDAIDNLENKAQEQMESHLEWFDSNTEDAGFFNLINEDEDFDGPDNEYRHEFIKWHIHLGACTFENKDTNNRNGDHDGVIPVITSNHLVKLIIEIPNLMIKNNKGRLLIVVRKIFYKKYILSQVSEYVLGESDSEQESDGEESRIANVMNHTERHPTRIDKSKNKKIPKAPIVPVHRPHQDDGGDVMHHDRRNNIPKPKPKKAFEGIAIRKVPDIPVHEDIDDDEDVNFSLDD
jgi:hypothetical protein